MSAKSNLNAHRKMGELIKTMRTTPEILGRVLYDNKEEFIYELQVNLEKGRDPYRRKWKPRKRSYPHPIMDKTGKLKNSYLGKRSKGSLTLINKTPYSRYHQTGNKKLPQRLILPTSEKGLPSSFQRIAKKNILNTLRKTRPPGMRIKTLSYD